MNVQTITPKGITPKGITLKTLNQHSLQEIFDYVVLHLLEQGQPSIDPVRNECAYRGPVLEGGHLKCAAGHLMTDEEHDPGFEGRAFDCLDLDAYRISPDRVAFVTRLQEIHDNAYLQSREEVIDLWVAGFRDLAKVYALDLNLDLRAYLPGAPI